MLALLNWRVWAALALAALLAASHIYVYRKGKHVVKTEWLASVAEANQESRRLEIARQSAVDSAVRIAATREAGIRADAARTSDAVRGLRDALASKQRSEESAASAAHRADSLGELLAASAEAHRDLAQRCDRHVSDLRTLLEAWPK